MNTQTQKTLHPLILHAKTLLIYVGDSDFGQFVFDQQYSRFI